MPLSIAISDDDGLHWPWIRDIDTGFGFCGPMNGTSMANRFPTRLRGCLWSHVAYLMSGHSLCRSARMEIGYDPDGSGVRPISIFENNLALHDINIELLSTQNRAVC